MKKTGIVFLCVVCLAMGWQARAQTFDNSGNGMLNGSYYFRQVYLYGDGSDASAAFGEITFNGSGSYTLNASAIDYSQGSGTLTSSGTYTISASGLGYITNPLASGSSNMVYGLVSQGIFIGSSTQNPSGFNDLFIAAPIGSATPAFSGTYSVAFTDLGLGISGKYQLSPNGSGSLGTVAVTYYGYDTTTSAAFTGSNNESGVTYKASNGAESMTFPSSTQSTTLPVSGQEYLYSSPDGNFVFGGSPEGFDFFVGVHASSSPTFSGLYYQAGIDLAGDAYYGSLDAIPSIGGLLGHQRILDLGSTYYDYTYSDSSQLNPDGSYDDGFALHHVFGQIGSLGAGSISVGYGTDGNGGINVAIQGPTLSGSGSAMYLNPTGIQNQSSSALFTAGIAPGEYITLTGNNLVTGTNVAPNFPTSYPTTAGLGGIEVLMNGYPAPLVYSCSKCDGGNDLIIAVTPWELTGTGIVGIQVASAAGRSNTVSLFQAMTAPGVKASENGLGDVSAQHAADFSLITESSPAQIGETVVLYAVGLGSVSPVLQDGQAGGSIISSETIQPLTVYFDDGVNAPAQATIGFSGLVAGYVNLYQLNVTVPSGINSGEVFVEIAGPDSYTSEASIPIGSSGLAVSAKADKQIHRRPPPATKAPRGLNPNVRLPAGAN